MPKVATLESFILPREKATPPADFFETLKVLQQKCLPCEWGTVAGLAMDRYFPKIDLIAAMRIRRRARKDEAPITGVVPLFMVGHALGTEFIFLPGIKDSGTAISNKDSNTQEVAMFGDRQVQVWTLDISPSVIPKSSSRRRMLRRRRFPWMWGGAVPRAVCPFLSNEARTQAQALLEVKLTPLVLWEVAEWKAGRMKADPMLLVELNASHYVLSKWNLTSGEEYIGREFTV